MRRSDRTGLACGAILALVCVAAKAQAAAVCGYVPSLDVRGPSAEVGADPRLLDAMVGSYRLNDYDLEDVFTVVRDGDRLEARLTGAPAIPLTPIGPGVFSYGDGYDQIVADIDGKGQVKRLVWRRNHLRDLPMARIGQAQAQKLTARYLARIDPETGAPRSEPALLRFVEGLQSGHPDYGQMGIYLNIATHRQLTHLRPFLNDLGPVQSVRFMGFMVEGLNGVPGETYDVVQKDGVSRWHIAVDDKGVIAGAEVRCGP